jgi:hypothetical protein
MSTGSRVLFMHLRNLSGWESRCHSYQSWPNSTVNECDLSIYKSTNQDIFGMSYCLEDGKNLVVFRMSPPAPLNWLVYDCLRQPRNRAFGRCENYAVLFDKQDRFIGGHTAPSYAQRWLERLVRRPHLSQTLIPAGQIHGLRKT